MFEGLTFKVQNLPLPPPKGDMCGLSPFRGGRGRLIFSVIQFLSYSAIYPIDLQAFTDEHFMKQALAEARQAAAEGEVPVGAVIVCNDRIIARAHNQTERLCDPTAHAEILAITAATGVLGAKYLTDCALFVTVEPCVMCAGAIGWAQISTLVFGATDEKRGYQLFAPKALHPKTIVKKGILENDCAAEMKLFFQKKR